MQRRPSRGRNRLAPDRQEVSGLWAYTKVARNSTSLDVPVKFSEKQPVWVVPSTKPSFKGKVALLIGPDTVSAGETFTTALMGREPHVMRISLNTQGVFSDVLHLLSRMAGISNYPIWHQTIVEWLRQENRSAMLPGHPA
jgi:hypothetical protein